MRTILVTGGAGFIGSHTSVELLERGHEVLVFDNFSNSERSVLERVEQITGKKAQLVEGEGVREMSWGAVYPGRSWPCSFPLRADRRPRRRVC